MHSSSVSYFVVSIFKLHKLLICFILNFKSDVGLHHFSVFHVEKGNDTLIKSIVHSLRQIEENA